MAGPKLKDVAAAAGVTSAAASMALSGRGRIGEETRKRIQRIAAEMNYEPNAAALLLKKKPLVDVALLIRDDTTIDPIVYPLACEQAGLSFRMELLAQGAEAERGLPQALLDRVAAGVLYCGHMTDGLRDYLDRHPDLPFVCIGDSAPYAVQSDFTDCAAEGLRELVKAGHERIALFAGDQEFAIHCQVKLGLERTVDELGLKKTPVRIFRRTTMKSCLVWANDLLKKKDRPTAVFCSGSTNAFALTYAALSLGLRIPEDLSLITLARPQAASLEYRPLTALEHDQGALLSTAIDLLKTRMAGKVPEAPQLFMPGRLVLRQSTRR